MPIDAKRVQAAFLVAIEVAEPAQQAAVLDRLCDGDAELRRRVEALLAAHDQSKSLPHAPIESISATTNQPALHRPGAVVAGRYKLLEQIGEGGMGAVWVAEQTEPVRRRVALKLIKPGMDTKQVLSRFAAERQALALMDHPNIAKVYDGGMTDEGRPFFVMEYVKGVPITEYCDQAKLSIDERLKLFLPICQAVQHAHQKGIIHRDLKPSNLLVCLYDGQPVPKVIDFGLAKAISQPLTEHTLYTAHGLMVGTPLYMSPEQAEFNNLDVDTRTDIYSLGVILYELLTGTTPLEKQKFKDAAFQEILRLIKEEEPPKPSTKLSGSATLPAIAAQRGLEPAQLSRLVRGELDWIVMKSLEKERSRRYETASSLTRDLERYLNDEPVEACPPSLSYKFSKFTKRNMRALVTASLFSTVVLASLITVAGSIGWVIRDGATRQAVVERKIQIALDKAESAYQQDKLADAQAAVHQAEGLLASSDTRPEVAKRFRQWMDDLAFVDQLEKIHLEKATTVKDEHFDPASAAMHYGKAFQDYGLDLQKIGPLDAAQKLQTSPIKKHLLAALDDWAFLSDEAQRTKLLNIARLADSDPWRNRFRAALESDEAGELKELAADDASLSQPAVTVVALAHQLTNRRERPAAQALLRRAHGRYPNDFWINVQLGNLLLLDAKADEAAIYLRIACTKSPNSPVAKNSLSVALDFSGKIPEALEEYRATIRMKPNFAMPHHNLASALARQGKLPEAEPSFREAVRLRSNDGPTHAALANCLTMQNKLVDAEKLYLEAIAHAPNDWQINSDYLELLEKTRRLQAALQDQRRKLSANPNDPLLHRFLGDLLRQSNSPAEAETSYRQAIQLDPQDFFAHTKLGGVLIEQNKVTEALPILRDAIRIAPDFAWAHLYLGAALNIQEKWAEAEQPLRKALELSPCSYPGYMLLLACLRSQNKDTANIPRPPLPRTNPFSSRTGPGANLSFNGQFELGAVAYATPTFLSADRVLAVGRGSFPRPPSSETRKTSPTTTSRTASTEEAQLLAAIRQNPKDWAARERLGSLLISQNSTGAATAMWDAVCADPTNYKFHAYLGVANRVSRAYSEAALRESIRLNPNYAYAHRHLAWALEGQGMYPEALTAIREAIRLEPTNAENYNILAWFYAKHGELAAAAAAYREEFKLRPTRAQSHNDFGLVLHRLGKTSEANTQFGLAKEQSPTEFSSQRNVGLRYASNSLLWHAAHHFQAAMNENPADDVSAVRAALLQLYLGDRTAYEATCKRMLEQCAKTTDGHTQRRTVHACVISPQTVGDAAQRKALLDLALSKPDDQRVMHYVHGLFAYREGQWSEAIKWCQQSRAEAPQTQVNLLVDAHDLMVEAMALHQQGKASEARKAYELGSRYGAGVYPFAPYSIYANWVDWLSYDFNHREATQLLAVTDNSDWPRSPSRGRALAGAGDWKAGAAEMARACQSPAATSADFIAAGTALARAEDRDGYRKHCQAMIERFGGTGNWQEIERTVKVCSLAPFDVEISSEMLAAVSKDIDNKALTPYLAAWGNTARAHAAYRQGRFSEAAQWADSAAQETAANDRTRAQGSLISAVAHHRLGDSKVAQQRLVSALEFRDKEPWPKFPDGSLNDRLLVTEFTAWYDVLAIDVLRREAVALIGDVPATTTAKTDPQSNQDARPLLSDEAVKAARRIKGWGAAWSPDGKSIARNLNLQDIENADLEVVNLITGTTTKLYREGKDPAWSPLPGGPIAFARCATGRSTRSEEIWLIQPDGSNPRKLADGGFPSWSNDGRLFYRNNAGSTSFALQIIHPDQPNSLPQSFPDAGPFPAVSPDGNLTAFYTANPRSLVVRNTTTLAAVATIDLAQVSGLLASWSPNSRYMGYGSYGRDGFGLWLLDVKTGKTALLATGSLTCPRWSPDGTTIAADDRQSSELVILDVSALNLENGFPDGSSSETSSSK